MAGRIRAGTPIGSCPGCLSWGSSYGSRSYCRACYDFVRRYRPGECAGCRRIIAVKKGHCRLCWLQAAIAVGPAGGGGGGARSSSCVPAALLSGSLRRQTLTALRSLFGHCKKTGRIFRDPTSGVHDRPRPLILIQPLQPAEIDQATSAAVTPAARLAVALAAVHAARPKTIRELHLDDVDLGNRRLVIAGRARPLDDLTTSLLLAWLQHRGRRWPGTANPHLIVNQQTAMTTQAVSENWLTENCRGLTATLERLRVDRQLEEALTHGADPLHLAAVFGIDDTTAIRYAAIARQLLEAPAEQHEPHELPRTQGPELPAEHEHP